MRPKNLKKCIKLNWNCETGEGSITPSVGEVRIFSRATQS